MPEWCVGCEALPDSSGPCETVRPWGLGSPWGALPTVLLWLNCPHSIQLVILEGQLTSEVTEGHVPQVGPKRHPAKLQPSSHPKSQKVIIQMQRLPLA